MADDVVKIDDLLAGLDRTGPVPLYYQVSTAIEQAIRSGEIPAGARIENEIAIGQRAGLSRPTIRRAMEELVDKGLLVRRRGIGTQVVQGQVTRQVELTSLYEDLKSSQHEPGTLVLEHDTRPADPDTAEALRVPVGSDIVYLRRQRSTDGVPVAVLTNYLPIEFSDITTERRQPEDRRAPRPRRRAGAARHRQGRPGPHDGARRVRRVRPRRRVRPPLLSPRHVQLPDDARGQIGVESERMPRAEASAPLPVSAARCCP